MRTDRVLEYEGIRLDIHVQTTEARRHTQIKSPHVISELIDTLDVALREWVHALDTPRTTYSRKYSGDDT